MGDLANQVCESIANGMTPEAAANILVSPSRWEHNLFAPARDLQTAYKAFLRGDISVGELYFISMDVASGADAVADLASRVSQGYGKGAVIDDVPAVAVEPEDLLEPDVVIEALTEARVNVLSPEQQAELEQAYQQRPPDDVKDFWNRFVTPNIEKYKEPENAEEVKGPNVLDYALQFPGMVDKLIRQGYPRGQAERIASKWARSWTPETAFSAKDEIEARPTPPAPPRSYAPPPVAPAPPPSAAPDPRSFRAPEPPVEIEDDPYHVRTHMIEIANKGDDATPDDVRYLQKVAQEHGTEDLGGDAYRILQGMGALGLLGRPKPGVRQIGTRTKDFQAMSTEDAMAAISGQQGPSEEMSRAKEALRKLGYPVRRAEAALRQAASEGATDETGLITKALTHLA